MAPDQQPEAAPDTTEAGSPPIPRDPPPPPGWVDPLEGLDLGEDPEAEKPNR